MFMNSKAKTIKELENFNTNKVADMHWMFMGSNATELNVSNFNTPNVTNMASMFQETKVTTLDLSGFDISKGENIKNMFAWSSATTGYAKDQVTADKFNDYSVTLISNKLKFVVKQ